MWPIAAVVGLTLRGALIFHLSRYLHVFLVVGQTAAFVLAFSCHLDQMFCGVFHSLSLVALVCDWPLGLRLACQFADDRLTSWSDKTRQSVSTKLREVTKSEQSETKARPASRCDDKRKKRPFISKNQEGQTIKLKGLKRKY